MALTPENEKALDALHPKMKHGFYVKKLPKSYEEAYIQALLDPNLTSLNPEIAFVRTLMMEHVARSQETLCITCGRGLAPDFDSMVKGAESIGRNIERMMGRRQVLTAKGVKTLIEGVARIVYEEIGKDDPKKALRVIECLKQLKPNETDFAVGNKKAG